jgi:hypothetical protein
MSSGRAACSFMPPARHRVRGLRVKYIQLATFAGAISRIESNRIESNRIESNQIRSDQIKSTKIRSKIRSNQIKPKNQLVFGAWTVPDFLSDRH